MTLRILMVLSLPLCSMTQSTVANPPSWDWQLDTPSNLHANVRILDLDPNLTSEAEIRALTARGVYTICYVSVGTWEAWRHDAAAFPRSVIGNAWPEWEGERFLDIRQHDILLPLMKARFTHCAEMGFDAVEPDVIDSYYENTGFALTAEDMVAYVNALIDAAHELGLEVGQKNAPELSEALSHRMSFAITEGCIAEAWCESMAPYFAAGKPVLDAEYNIPPEHRPAACAYGDALGLSIIFKTPALDKYRDACD